MPVERWSDQVSVARLADDPQFTDDLQSLQDEMEQRSVNAVLDFSSVHYINSSNIARLLRLRKRAVSTDLKLIGIVDDFVTKQFLGMPVLSPDRLTPTALDGESFGRVIVMSIRQSHIIEGKLRTLGVPPERTVLF